MEKLQFDTGLRRYKVGAGVLEFNPTDPNLYSRFLDCLRELEALEAQLQAAPRSGEEALGCIREADKAVMAALGRVFPGNDLEAIFRGVSLLAVGSNGERVLVNFLAALEPVLRKGALECAREVAAAL